LWAFNNLLEFLTKDFLILWTTIDPIGTLALFAALTSRKSKAERRRIAFKSVFYAFAVLLGSVVLGQFILAGMGIRLISLQVAGGIILFLFGLKMIFGGSFEGESERPEKTHDLAVFPIAIPAIATPGAIMAVIVLTDNNVYSIAQQAMTTGVLAVVLLITYLMMLLCDRILKVIGQNGALILVKVMGMLLAALSVELFMEAIGAERWLNFGSSMSGVLG